MTNTQLKVEELYEQSKLFKSYHKEILNNNMLRQGRIIRLKNYLANDCAYCSMNIQEAALLNRYTTSACIRVEPEQSDKGLSWLRTKCKTPTGRYRKHNPFTKDQELMIFDNFSHFTFDGYHLGDKYNMCNRHVYPIYTVHDKEGNSFSYISAPWVTIEFSGQVAFEVI